MIRPLQILFCLALYCSLQNESAFAQTNVYHPFPDSNAVWRNKWATYCGLGLTCTSDYQYILKGDTIISGLKYSKIYKEGNWRGCHWDSAHGSMNYYSCSVPSFSSVFSGGIRNDSINKKVFHIQQVGFPEELLYDFSLNIGDTLFSTIAYKPVLSNIDSVLINGNYRKRYSYTSGSSFSVIEGIGAVSQGGSTTYAELFSIGPCVCWDVWYFICFSQNGNYMYGDTTCTSINPVQIISNDYYKEQINIYPNPNQGEFNFDAKQNKGHIIIYNVIGEKVFETNAESNSINIKLQTSGVYHLCFTTQDGVFTRKIVVTE